MIYGILMYLVTCHFPLTPFTTGPGSSLHFKGTARPTVQSRPERDQNEYQNQKCEPMKSIRKRCPVNSERGSNACNSLWSFFWDKTKIAKTPGGAYSKKKHTRKTSTDQNDLPRHLRSFLPKGSKKRGHQWSPGTGSVDPANPIQSKKAKSHSIILVLSRTQGSRRVSKHIEKDRVGNDAS